MPDAIQHVRGFRQQAAQAVAALEREIAKQEKELRDLKRETARWRSVLAGKSAGGSATVAPSRTRRARKQLDWNAVLAGLPGTFTTKEVAQKTAKPPDQISAGIARWVKANKVRKGREGYRKLAAPTAPRVPDKAAT